MGRDIEICVGIPTQEVLDEFMAYPNYQNIPSLCELTPENVRAVNARVWGPRWTLGTKNDQVAASMRRDARRYIDTGRAKLHPAVCIQQGIFDGILSNYPMAVAYQYYIQ